MKRLARAVWQGNMEEGSGTLTTKSGVLQEQSYTFANRFREDPGTNPEELIGAAHAGCFSMAFAGELAKAGFQPQEIETNAEINLEKVDGKWTVTGSHLKVEAVVSDIGESQFLELAEGAKRDCPISRLLKAEITMDANLRQGEAAASRTRPAEGDQTSLSSH